MLTVSLPKYSCYFSACLKRWLAGKVMNCKKGRAAHVRGSNIRDRGRHDEGGWAVAERARRLQGIERLCLRGLANAGQEQ